MRASQKLKALHRTQGKGQSLKSFARKLAKGGNDIAKAWLKNKKG